MRAQIRNGLISAPLSRKDLAGVANEVGTALSNVLKKFWGFGGFRRKFLRRDIIRCPNGRRTLRTLVDMFPAVEGDKLHERLLGVIVTGWTKPMCWFGRTSPGL